MKALEIKSTDNTDTLIDSERISIIQRGDRCLIWLDTKNQCISTKATLGDIKKALNELGKEDKK